MQHTTRAPCAQQAAQKQCQERAFNKLPFSHSSSRPGPLVCQPCSAPPRQAASIRRHTQQHGRLLRQGAQNPSQVATGKQHTHPVSHPRDRAFADVTVVDFAPSRPSAAAAARMGHVATGSATVGRQRTQAVGFRANTPTRHNQRKPLPLVWHNTSHKRVPCFVCWTLTFRTNRSQPQTHRAQATHTSVSVHPACRQQQQTLSTVHTYAGCVSMRSTCVGCVPKTCAMQAALWHGGCSEPRSPPQDRPARAPTCGSLYTPSPSRSKSSLHTSHTLVFTCWFDVIK